MKQRIRSIEHEGTPVLLLDYSEMDAEGVLSMIAEVRKEVPRHPRGSLLVLVDATGARFNAEVVRVSKEVTRAHREYERASAFVGLSAMQRLAFRTAQAFSGRSDMRDFRTREEALAWLVEQGQRGRPMAGIRVGRG
jgi:hypothetical protein